METLTKKKERTFSRGDFDLTLRLDEAHLFIEASNSSSYTYYTTFLSNKTIEEATQHLFSNIEDLYEVLSTAFDSKSSKPNGIYVKFNKKEVYIFVKIEFALPIKKVSSFYLYLKPQGLGAPSKKIHTQIDELEKKISNLEKTIEDSSLAKNLLEKIRKVESFLEKTNGKNMSFHEETTQVKAAKINGKPKKEPKNSHNSMDVFEIPKPSGSLRNLSFDSKTNVKYFKFKENDCKISRTTQDKKMHILAWSSTPLDKSSKIGQYFEVRIEKLNPEFEIINACVGIMNNDGSKKLTNLAEHNGEGCYLYSMSNQFFWINDVKTKTTHKFGRPLDLIRVSVNFATRKIKWTANRVEIGEGDLDLEQINEFQFYPVVTLAFNKESVRISGYFPEVVV